MKKITLILTIALTVFSLSVFAQNICDPPCTPDAGCVDLLNPGEVCPEILPTAMETVYYDETITVIPPETFEILGSDYDIYQIRIDAVEGLPAGMTWCKSQVMFPVTSPATSYCCQLTGTPETEGEYQLTLKITPYYNFFGTITALPQQTDDTSLLVIVLPYVAPPVAAFNADLTSLEQGGNVTFTDASTNTPTAWAWTFEGGNPPASSDQNPVVNYPTAGNFDVTLTAYNAGGENSITMTDYITVSSGSGIESQLINNVKVYPNPATHEITVEAANLESVTIVDVLGKVVYSQNAKSEKEVIDISTLLKANYFIKVKTAEGEITKSITIR